MASTSSSTAVSAMAERASEQYLACRRSVTAKVDEVKQLDGQISTVFEQIAALSKASEGQEKEPEDTKASIKSVGRLVVTLAGVEGEEPVPNATITVSLDPEYETDEYETVEEVVEKKDIVVTDEHGHVMEDGQAVEKECEDSPRKLKTTTKITRTVIKKRVKKVPVMRTIAWTADAKSKEDTGETETMTFPATFVFNPVQSREAVVVVTVAAGDEDEGEPVKEIEFAVSSLFQDNTLDKWYSIVDEEQEEEPTSITELVEELVEEVLKEEVAAAMAEKVERTDDVKTDEAEEKKEPLQETTASTVEEAKNSEEVGEIEVVGEAEEAGETEVVGETEEAGTTEEARETEDAGETVEADKHEMVDDVKQVEEAAKNDKDGKIEEKKPASSRFHVKANFVLSEAEKLSISVVALSKKKQEAEAALLVLEREAASLRTKYDRLNASQRQLKASSISKPRSNFLSSRFGASSMPVQPKSWYQTSRERTNAFIMKHQQVLVSAVMFAGSVCLFHFNGENLLA